VLRLTQRWLPVAAFLCGACALASMPARCIAQAPLSFDRRGCVSAWADGIERFTAIELAAAPEDQPEGALELSVRCQGDEVEITASERGAASTHRRMDLTGTADAVRSRVVALAIAGLVRELAVMARSAPSTAPEPERAPIAREAQPTASGDSERNRAGSARTVQLDLFPAGSTFTAAPAVLWGGGLRARALLFGPLYAALDVQAGSYARDSELGSARLVAGSAGARIGWTYAWRSSLLGAGAGQRLGLARASASAEASGATDGSVSGLWAAPVAFVMADTALARHVRLGVDAELGAVLLPVRGRIEEGGDIAVAGAWLALSATLGVQL